METIEDIRNLPDLSVDAIHIWGIHVPGILNRLDKLSNVLNLREREKAARLRRENDRHCSVVARGALRMLLAGYTGHAPSEIEFAYSENGKPHLFGYDIAFNVSHSNEWTVIAIGCDRAIGVDIELIRRDMDVQSIASRYFTMEERVFLEETEDAYSAFFQIWVRKEAYVKACGSTLFTELKCTSVPVGDGLERGGWFFHDLEAGSKYAAAVVTDKPLARLPCYDFGGLKWQS